MRYDSPSWLPVKPVVIGGLLLALCTSVVAEGWANSTVTTLPTSSQDGWTTTPTVVATSPELPDKQWWLSAGDPYLIATLEAVLAHNWELKQAQATLKEARAQIRETLGGALPTISLNPSAIRQKNSANLIVPNRGQLSGGGPRLFAPGATINTFSLPLQATWEVDLWLKTWDATQYAKATLKQREANERALRLALITDAATAYWNWIGAEAGSDLLKQSIALAKEKVALELDRLQAGLISGDAVAQARQTLAQQEQLLASLEQTKLASQYQLAVLMGKTPAAMAQWPHLDYASWEATPMASLTDTLAAGTPYEALTRRPDIAVAEAQLTAQAIQVRLARKAFLPTFNLSGQYGFASTELSNWLSQTSKLWNIGGNAAISLFQGGQKWYRLKRDKAVYEQTVANYQKTVLTALQEVEISLATVQQAITNAQQQQLRAQASHEELTYVQDRERVGLVSMADVLPYKQNQLQLAQQLTQERVQAAVAKVSLYKALGGDF